MSEDRKYPDTPEGLAEALRAFAREQNEVARHNLRVLKKELRQAADARGLDWRHEGGMERVREARAKDADVGHRTRQSPGRPPTAPAAETLLADMRAEQEKVARKMSDSEAAGYVGNGCKPPLSAAHVMKLTRHLRTP